MSQLSDTDLMLKLTLQLVVILLTCRVVGWVGRRFLGQTQVVMEMIAGIALGPSLLGAIAPKAQEWLFPREAIFGAGTHHPSMSILFCVSQLGLILYMFLVGLEFDTKVLTQSKGSALAVSVAGIAAPFVLGGMLGYSLSHNGVFFGASVTPGNAILYTGAAMCITAFPTLSRILYEQGLIGTPVGTLALASGASNDVVAWALLAAVIGFSKSDPRYALYAMGGGVLYTLLILTIGKRALRPLGPAVEKAGHLTGSTFLIPLICVLICAWFTDLIGIYAVFGAFLVGVAMPKGEFSRQMEKQLQIPVSSLLLPIFFVYSGLNTKVGLLDSPRLWLITALVCAIAVLGKGVGCALAARGSGHPWRESWAIGSLMNARGMMELILVNIALAAKIITPTLFTILVIMAVLTTLMASPLSSWLLKTHVLEDRSAEG